MASKFIQKPYLSFFLGFGVAVAYVPGWIGASVPTGWFFLLIAMPIVFCFCELELNRNIIIGLAFIIYAALSLIWTHNLNIGIFILFQILVLACVFCLGENLKTLKWVFSGLALGLGVSSVVALLQQYTSYQFIFALYNPVVGLFVNPNIYSEISAVMLVALIVLKLWWWIPVTIPGLILIQSRTAFIGLAAGLFVWLFNKNKLAALLSVFITVAVAAFFYRHRFSYESIQERFDLWADTYRGLKLFGNGVGSFEILYPLYAINIDTAVARPRFAHNDLLQAVFEFGVGSFLLVLLIINVLRIKHETTAILFAFGAISLSAYPFHIPMSAFIGCLVAGFVNRNAPAVGNFRFNWGSNLFAGSKGRRLSLY